MRGNGWSLREMCALLLGRWTDQDSGARVSEYWLATGTELPGLAVDRHRMVWLYETPQALPRALSDTPASSAARNCLRRPNGTRRPRPCTLRKAAKARQRPARDACYRLHQTGFPVLIGARLEPPQVVIDLAAINTLRGGGGAAPVYERLTRKQKRLLRGVRPISLRLALKRS